jgi:hypothetical protein
MRTLDEHIVNTANDKLKIEVTDDPGKGGANHRYEISGYLGDTNTSIKSHEQGLRVETVIVFQNGAIGEDGTGVNGVTHEALLAIVADRLRSFQKGPYNCRENSIALTKIEEAQLWLQRRTLQRMRRGVEGTHTV